MNPPDLAMLVSLFALPDAVILIVDDVPENLRLLRLLLTTVGCQVLEASSADAARQQLLKTTPDVILLDIMMPGTDGYALCKEWKADPRYAEIPIIFLSGLNEPANKLKAFSVGGTDYVSKPFEPAEVLARVNHHYKMLRTRQALQREKELLAQINDELNVARQETADVFGVMADQLRGKVLDGKFLLEEKIGSGGFAVVYKARQMTLQRTVAVKVLRPANPERVAQRLHRFRQEVTSAARIKHPNVTSVIDAATSSDGITYLVMELLDGHALSAELRPQSPLPLSRCMQILMPVCEVLAAAHSVGVVHRDIKPGNIFLHRQGDVEVVKVLDFGIAKLIDAPASRISAATMPGEMVGTISYMSPEQIRGEPCDGRTDVYAVGITLYEMLTGQVPFPALGEASIGTLMNHLSEAPVAPSLRSSTIPEELDAVVLSALSKDPAQRPTMVDFTAQLLAAGRLLLGDELLEQLRASGKPAIS